MSQLFLKAVVAGFGVLLNWEIWLGAVLYMGAMLSFLLFTANLASKRLGTGCLVHLIVGPLVQGTLVSLYVGVLLPTILFGDSPVSLSGDSIVELLLAGLVAMVVVIGISVVPLFGQILANSPSIQGFIIGVIVFRSYAGEQIEALSVALGVGHSVYPGLMPSIGFIIIAGVFSILGVFVQAVLSTATHSETGPSGGELLLTVAVSTNGVVGGLLPFFMYAQYVILALYSAGGVA